VRGMAAALRGCGLVERLGAEDAGVVAAPAYGGSVDAGTRVRNAGGVREFSLALAGKVGELLDGGLFPVVLGGDCSILLGSALALRRRGRFGLLFVDGHSDLLTPESSETGGAAGMDLALVTGVGPEMLSSIDGLGPYVRQEDVVVLGYRWPEVGSGSGALPVEGMMDLPLEVVRRDGAEAVALRAVKRFADRDFWVHVDVLDPVWMAAVDSPDPGGLHRDELLSVVRAAVWSPRCVGMEMTIYDPELDVGGNGARLIVDLLVGAFAG